ncbi:MAG TPA: M56 family metallopeptidase [Verrucomicrobiota bacterium]|nr:hypothetical protein [Verrucomicrobiales bacterium]HRI15487.1 M56 family metallopeptidase [Verrucomicrobiota bacterium]
MNLISSLLAEPFAATLGIVLAHFLWQGSLIAAGLAVVLRFGRNRSAGERHRWACMALLLLLLVPALTLAWLTRDGGFVNGPARLIEPLAEAPHSLSPSSLLTLSDPVSSQWLAGAAWIWGIGVFGFALRLLGGWWQTQRLSSRAAHLVSPEWQQRFEQRRKQLGIRRRVRLFESWRVSAPIVVGWLRPVILLPVGMLTGIPPAQVEAIFLHELAHIRAHDHLINWLQRIAETLLFYHPAVWWVSEQIRREREHRCDDIVALTMGEGRSLANALLTMVEQTATSPGSALAADGASVADRIRRLVSANPNESPVSGWPWKWIIFGMLLVAFAVWLVPILRAPRLYQSTVRFKIEQPSVPGSPGYDPYYLANQFELLRSSSILRPVLADIAVQRNDGTRVNSETVRRLQSRLQIRQYRNTAIVELTVADEDNETAAKLANSIVTTFRDLRTPQNRQLEQTVMKGDRLRSMLEEATADLVKFSDGHAEDLKKMHPGVQIERDLLQDRITMLRDAKLQNDREILNDMLADLAPAKLVVEIIDFGEPGLRPVRWHPLDR